MVTPRNPLEALQSPPEALAATFTPAYPSERLLRLPGGSWVPSCSESWRQACEMREIAARPAPDAELQLRAARRSGKDDAAAARILAELRRQLRNWLALVAEPDPDLIAAARLIVELPTRDARRAAVASVAAGAGTMAGDAVADHVRALWAAR
jgi:hypothetical protein